MRAASIVSICAFALTSACGGQKSSPDPSNADDLDETTTKAVTSGDGDGDVSSNGGEGDGTGSAVAGDGDGDGTGATAPDAGPPPPSGPALTINIKNIWTKPIEFNHTLGWGSRIQMYSGKPPNAVAIEPFARACTAACSVQGKDRCPVCKKHTSLGQIRKHQKANTTVVAPGATHTIEWDGMAHEYTKTKISGRTCSCHSPVQPAAAKYTVRVCGLRVSKKHRKKSKLQCITKEDILDLPSTGPVVLDFEFDDPNKKPAKKAKTAKTP